MIILAALDFSDVTKKIVEALRKRPWKEGARLFLVHVAEPDPDFVGWETGPDVVRDQMAAEFHRERTRMEAVAEEFRQDGIDAIALVVQGSTVRTILDEADRRSADLLVVGSHGHGAAYDLVVGSISSGVIRASKVPVLVVPNR